MNSTGVARTQSAIPTHGHQTSGRPVLLVMYHYYPSNSIGARRCTAVARHLSASGRRVIVVSAFDGSGADPSDLDAMHIAVPVVEPHGRALDFLIRCKRALRAALNRLRKLRRQALPTPHAPEQDTVHRPPGFPRRVIQLLQVIDAHKQWAWRAARAGLRAARQNDVAAVVCSAPPWSSTIAAMWIAKKLGVPLIVDFRDPWTDWPDYDERPLALTRRLNRHLETMVLRRASAVICTTPNLARRLVVRLPELACKTHVAMNAYDSLEPRSKTTGHRLSILFAGELYMSRNPMPFLEALEQLLARPGIDSSRVSLTMVGYRTPFWEQHLGEWLRGKRSASVVRMLAPVPMSEIAAIVDAATLLLNFNQRSPLTIPAKTFEQFGQGREIMVLCEQDSATAQVAAGLRGVTRIDADDTPAIAAALADIYRRHALLNTLTPPDPNQIARYARRIQNDRIASVVDSVCDGLVPRPAPQD